MLQNIRFKINQGKVNKKLGYYEDREVNRYIAECRMIDGSVVYFGARYNATMLEFDEWIKGLLYKDSIHTDNDTYIKTENIVEAKLHSVSMEIIKFNAYDYWDARYTFHYSKDRIEEDRKEYNRLLALSKIK